MTTVRSHRSAQEAYQRACSTPPIADVERALAARQQAYADHAAAAQALAEIDGKREAALAADVDQLAAALSSGKKPPAPVAEPAWAEQRRQAERLVDARDQLLAEAHSAFLVELAEHGAAWQASADAAAGVARAQVHEAAEHLLTALGQHNRSVRASVWVARAREDHGRLPSMGFSGELGAGSMTKLIGAGGGPTPSVKLAQAIAEAYRPSLPVAPEPANTQADAFADDVA